MSKLVVPSIGCSVGSAMMLLLSGSSDDDDSGDSSSRQRLLWGGVFVRLVSLRKRGELLGSQPFVMTSDYSNNSQQSSSLYLISILSLY